MTEKEKLPSLAAMGAIQKEVLMSKEPNEKGSKLNE